VANSIPLTPGADFSFLALSQPDRVLANTKSKVNKPRKHDAIPTIL
jgi:hypothetical protein